MQCGARRLAATRDAETSAGAFVLPVDVPCAGAEVWRALEAGLDDRVDACVPTFEGAGGHPVLCREGLLGAILATAPDAVDARLDFQLRRCQRIARVAVDDPRVRLNLNTPADWAARSTARDRKR